ncbi:hypothetical protein G7Y89_g6224 [Cudoniella acicularis]|uniref:Nuclease S1 n=1 Tax=Cudoniella acicularis TaxID=354080 RepID=A0A8H4W2M9_9HELO|nr:hypothetical protein G7Y89_g6224 [Cudoniella acicularis]
MKFSNFSSVLSLLSLIPASQAWGTLGHHTVAYVATNFVHPKTRVLFQSILNDITPSYLANIATWADTMRYVQGWGWSAPLHFIDAEDDPPHSCAVKYSRDCGEHGCIVGAIQNFTQQLLNPSLGAVQRSQAAKFIVHFLGDIHQPLHDEGMAKGGNGIHVIFDGDEFNKYYKPLNLHSVWDTTIPEKIVGGNTLLDAENWAANLTTAIETGIYKTQVGAWTNSMNLADPASTALSWASETNVFVCTTVMPNGREAIEGTELNGTYYEASAPVIELQIARAGYRLARWMDLIAGNFKTEL